MMKVSEEIGVMKGRCGINETDNVRIRKLAVSATKCRQLQWVYVAFFGFFTVFLHDQRQLNL